VLETWAKAWPLWAVAEFEFYSRCEGKSLESFGHTVVLHICIVDSTNLG
jgi:hypothetical protein